MNFAVIGSGGREHAICYKLSQSAKLNKLICIPGNAGTKKIAENIIANINDFEMVYKIIKEKNIEVRGLELNQENVQQCIHKGLPVIQGNAETELHQFPNKSFDYVVLSQTLQAFFEPEKVLNQLLRIGKQTIVSIPNFGYWKVRLHLLFKGTMPVTKNLPNEWYDTPNLHMCTIQDFINFCDKKNIKIDKSMCLTNEKISKITNRNRRQKNIFSQLGIFLIQ